MIRKRLTTENPSSQLLPPGRAAVYRQFCVGTKRGIAISETIQALVEKYTLKSLATSESTGLRLFEISDGSPSVDDIVDAVNKDNINFEWAERNRIIDQAIAPNDPMF